MELLHFAFTDMDLSIYLSITPPPHRLLLPIPLHLIISTYPYKIGPKNKSAYSLELDVSIWNTIWTSQRKLPPKKEKKLQRRNFILPLHHLYTSASRRQPLFKNKSSVRGQTELPTIKEKADSYRWVFIRNMCMQIYTARKIDS